MKTKLGVRKRYGYSVKHVPKNFCGECTLSQLPSNTRTYFKLVKKDGSLSKKIYVKEKGSYNRYSRKYDICDTSDVYGSGREMSGKTRVSTRFTY